MELGQVIRLTVAGLQRPSSDVAHDQKNRRDEPQHFSGAPPLAGRAQWRELLPRRRTKRLPIEDMFVSFAFS